MKKIILALAVLLTFGVTVPKASAGHHRHYDRSCYSYGYYQPYYRSYYAPRYYSYDYYDPYVYDYYRPVYRHQYYHRPSVSFSFGF